MFVADSMCRGGRRAVGLPGIVESLLCWLSIQQPAVGGGEKGRCRARTSMKRPARFEQPFCRVLSDYSPACLPPRAKSSRLYRRARCCAMPPNVLGMWLVVRPFRFTEETPTHHRVAALADGCFRPRRTAIRLYVCMETDMHDQHHFCSRSRATYQARIP